MISIAMAVYNGEKYIDKQLSSIVNQTKLPDEIVITDDSENNETYNKINLYINKYKNIKWKYINNKERLGFCQNFLEAIKNTTGDIIFLADQDDIWEKDKILSMTNILQNNNDIDLLCCKYVYIDSQDNQIDCKQEYSTSLGYILNVNFFRKELYHMPFKEFIKIVAFPGMCFAFKRQIVNELQKLLSIVDKSYIEYHDLILSYIAAKNDGFCICNKSLCKYRMHGNNAIGVNLVNGKGKEDRYKWLQHLINIQNGILEYEKIYNDGKYSNFIESVINFNNKRLIAYEENSIFKIISLLKKFGLFLSLKSFIGDIVYIIKKGKNYGVK